MRISGGYSLHQSLTTETAAIVKHAVGLARRRGHMQVTPLHVATAMLSYPGPTPLLRQACLEAHSHPLQCKALELCFNVALNRLPTSSSTSLLGRLPSLSNALVAAFKRAQAQQRRGSVETQQPAAALALKVKVGQLVLSILDDPSISRVMREAGFSSAHVKGAVERSLSLEKCGRMGLPSGDFKFSSQGKDEVGGILDAMTSGQLRNIVFVGECASVCESMAGRVIERLEKKEVPSEFSPVEFLRFPLSGLRGLSRIEMETRVAELRSVVRMRCSGAGMVLYLGDLDWVFDGFGLKYEKDSVLFHNYNCPLEYMLIMELSRIVAENKRVRLMGIATFRTYAMCKKGNLSLEALWSLQPLTIPVSSLALGVSCNNMHDQVTKEADNGDDDDDDESSWLLLIEKAGFIINKQLVCCSACSANFKKETRAYLTSTKHSEMAATSASTSKLPTWLQKYKDENPILQTNIEQYDQIDHLCKKWNTICSSTHTKPDFLGKLVPSMPVSSSSSPSSSTSVSSSSGPHKLKALRENGVDWPVLYHETRTYKNLLAEQKPYLLSNPNSSPNSASSSEDNCEKFSKIGPVNFDILSHELENKVPWQKCITPEIVSAILKCRSGMSLRKKTKNTIPQGSCWLFFSGADSGGKVAVARELARIIFGSYEHFVPIQMRLLDDQTSIREEEISDTNRGTYGRFVDAVCDNPRCVFYIENADKLERCCWEKFEKASKEGSVDMKDAIVIFSCEDDNARGELRRNEKKAHESFDLNMAITDDYEIENSSLVPHEVEISSLVDHKVVFKNPAADFVNA